MSIENNEINVMDEINIKNNLINYMDAEVKRLKAELKTAQEGIDDLNDVLKDMQKENIQQIESNKELQDKLQAVNDDYNNDNKVHNEYADGLLEEVNELKAELDKAHDNNMSYACLKEYKAEADEYFDNNPKCKELLFFMVDSKDFNNDEEYNHFLYKDDCLISINNNNYEGGN